MKFCENRLEGFGPSSQISSPLPTSCFIDTILIPIPTWLYLLTLPLLAIYTHIYTTKNFDPSTAHIRLRPHSKFLSLRGILSLLYYVLIIANILMQTLEIVRLELIHNGIGLLPFSYVSLGLSFLIHASDGFKGRLRGWVWANIIWVWMGGVVMCCVQAVGLAKQGFGGVQGREGSRYLVRDQVIDVGVMAGVYVVVGVLELALFATRPKIRMEGDEETEFGETMIVDLDLGRGSFSGK